MEIYTQVIGWIGMLLVVSAYFLVSSNKIQATSKSYHLLNFFGAVGVGVNVFYEHAWPAFILQIVWIFITIFTLTKKKK